MEKKKKSYYKKKSPSKKKKTGPKTKRKNAGRKLFDGKSKELVIKKLEEAFAYGASDKEACFYADISTVSFYAYIKKNPAFHKRKEQLKEKPILSARKSVVDGLASDPNLALKFLERKRKKEFSLRTEHTGEDGNPIEHKITGMEIK